MATAEKLNLQKGDTAIGIFATVPVYDSDTRRGVPIPEQGANVDVVVYDVLHRDSKGTRVKVLDRTGELPEIGQISYLPAQYPNFLGEGIEDPTTMELVEAQIVIDRRPNLDGQLASVGVTYPDGRTEELRVRRPNVVTHPQQGSGSALDQRVTVVQLGELLMHHPGAFRVDTQRAPIQ